MALTEKKKAYLKEYYQKVTKEKRQQNSQIVKTCAYCGNSFVSSPEHRKYCSDECSLKAYKEKMKKYRQDNKEHLKEVYQKYKQTEKGKEVRKNADNNAKERRQNSIVYLDKVCKCCGKPFKTYIPKQARCNDCIEKGIPTPVMLASKQTGIQTKINILKSLDETTREHMLSQIKEPLKSELLKGLAPKLEIVETPIINTEPKKRVFIAKQVNKKCIVCGKDFVTSNKNKETCTDECQKIYNRIANAIQG